MNSYIFLISFRIKFCHDRKYVHFGWGICDDLNKRTDTLVRGTCFSCAPCLSNEWQKSDLRKSHRLDPFPKGMFMFIPEQSHWRLNEVNSFFCLFLVSRVEQCIIRWLKRCYFIWDAQLLEASLIPRMHCYPENTSYIRQPWKI